MTILFRFLPFILLFLSILNTHVQPCSIKKAEKREKLEIEGKKSGEIEIEKISRSKKIIMIGAPENQASLIMLDREIDKEEIPFKNLNEAQDYLRGLLKERKEFEKDFYGVNITAYRYANIFNRMGYIRYKISEIDKEIKKTRIEIDKLKKINKYRLDSPRK
jgi:hypothetical protein